MRRLDSNVRDEQVCIKVHTQGCDVYKELIELPVLPCDLETLHSVKSFLILLFSRLPEEAKAEVMSGIGAVGYIESANFYITFEWLIGLSWRITLTPREKYLSCGTQFVFGYRMPEPLNESDLNAQPCGEHHLLYRQFLSLHLDGIELIELTVNNNTVPGHFIDPKGN